MELERDLPRSPIEVVIAELGRRPRLLLWSMYIFVRECQCAAAVASARRGGECDAGAAGVDDPKLIGPQDRKPGVVHGGVLIAGESARGRELRPAVGSIRSVSTVNSAPPPRKIFPAESPRGMTTAGSARIDAISTGIISRRVLIEVLALPLPASARLSGTRTIGVIPPSMEAKAWYDFRISSLARASKDLPASSTASIPFNGPSRRQTSPGLGSHVELDVKRTAVLFGAEARSAALAGAGTPEGRTEPKAPGRGYVDVLVDPEQAHPERPGLASRGWGRHRPPEHHTGLSPKSPSRDASRPTMASRSIASQNGTDSADSSVTLRSRQSRSAGSPPGNAPLVMAPKAATHLPLRFSIVRTTSATVRSRKSSATRLGSLSRWPASRS